MSRNLNQKLNHLTLIEDWYETDNKLKDIFQASMQQNVFSSIYVSIRRNPHSEIEQATDTYDYYNVGADSTLIAKYFNTRFSLNYFAYDFNDADDVQKLTDRITAIYETNKYTYMKLIETMGYRYNPLYNVDGIELYSRAESIGDAENNRTPTGTITTTSGTKNNDVIGNSESIYYKNPYDENSDSATIVDNRSTQSAITTEQGYSENYNEKTTFENVPAENYKYNTTTGKWEKDGLFTVAAKDNAFGVTFSGPERYFAEKKLRQGNIGVTKSTELLQAQRDLVRFNILDEFFNDLQREIVVGIY